MIFIDHLSDLNEMRTYQCLVLMKLNPRPVCFPAGTMNISCFYQMSPRSMTCEWTEESNTESEVSLTFKR